MPETLLVVGAGFIAVEFARIMTRLGSQVHLVYRGDLPLRGFDEDLRQRVAQALQAKGVQLHSGHAPQKLERDGDAFALHLEGGEQLRRAAVLNATGRSPNTQGIGLEGVGISVNKKARFRSMPTAAPAWSISGPWAMSPIAST